MPIVAKCPCGQSFSAKDELAGKKVKCPVCGQAFVVPRPERPAPAPADDPLGLGDAGEQGLFDDPLGPAPPTLPDASPDPLAPGQQAGGFPSPQWPAAPGFGPSGIPPPGQAPAKPAAEPLDTDDVLRIIGGVLAIVHGGLGTLGFLYAIFSLLPLMGGISISMIFSIGCLIPLIHVLVNVGLLVAGIMILLKNPNGMVIGLAASCVYFVLIALGIVMSIVSMVQLSQSPLAQRLGVSFASLFLRMILYTAISSIAPAFLVYLHHREQQQ